MDKSRYAALAAFIAVLTPLVTLLADKGGDALSTLAAVPKVLAAWASALPLGWGSFLLSLILATLVWVAFVTLMPPTKDARRPHLSGFTATVGVALSVTLLQYWVAGKGSPSGLVMALVVGLIAGLMAPWAGMAVLAARAKPTCQPLPKPQGEP